MPEIYFYINIKFKPLFLSQLLQKILRTTNDKIVVLTAEDDFFQQQLSDAIWTTLPDSFIPNEVINEKNLNTPTAPVIIQTNHQNFPLAKEYNIIIDYTFSPIDDNQFNKILYLGENEDEINRCRRLYQHYQLQGHPIKYFDMSHHI